MSRHTGAPFTGIPALVHCLLAFQSDQYFQACDVSYRQTPLWYKHKVLQRNAFRSFFMQGFQIQTTRYQERISGARAVVERHGQTPTIGDF